MIMVMWMFMDWFRWWNRLLGSVDDSLTVYYFCRYRFVHDGDGVLVTHGDDSCVLDEPGIGGMMRTVVPLVVDDDWFPCGLRLECFLEDVVVAFARWSGLSAFKSADTDVDCSGFEMVSWCDCHYCHFLASCRREWESLTHGFHFRVPANTGGSVYFSTAGVMLADGTDGTGYDAYLVMGKDFINSQNWRVLIGPFTVDDLVHELRVLCDSGLVDSDSTAGLVVKLAELEASFRTGVPCNVAMEDIIDGYPGADEYMVKHGSCTV